MSQYLTMEVEQEGPAKIIPGDLESGDLFFANNIPYSHDVVCAAAEKLNVKSIFDFVVSEELQSEAEVTAFGKTLDDLEDEDDDFELTEEIEDKINLVYYRIGPWYTVDEGIETGRILLKYFLENPELTESQPGSGVIGDLEEFLTALEEVKKRGKRFRLDYSY
ncbi:MAG: hypothetical protein KME17_21505 [Cyanosarcina radialis HA8281-LM2]|jgi:hypothetical protein|nr:hypothetical protein [Cyanosarcina radialis HA8281-LM2]